MSELEKAARMALDALEEINKLIKEALAQSEHEHVIDCPRCGHCCPQPDQESIRQLLISAAAMAVVMVRNGTYERASDVANAVLSPRIVEVWRHDETTEYRQEKK